MILSRECPELFPEEPPEALPCPQKQQLCQKLWKEPEVKRETWGQLLTLLTNGGAVLVGSLSWSWFSFSIKWVKNACPSNTPGFLRGAEEMWV